MAKLNLFMAPYPKWSTHHSYFLGVYGIVMTSQEPCDIVTADRKHG